MRLDTGGLRSQDEGMTVQDQAFFLEVLKITSPFLVGLLTAGVAIVAQFFARASELRKERLRRRLDAIEKITDEFEAATRIYSDATVEAAQLAYGRGDVEKTIAAVGDVQNAMSHFSHIESRLRLLRLPQAIEALDEVSGAADEVRGFTLQTLEKGAGFNQAELILFTNLSKKVNEAKTKFYRLLSEEY